MIFWSEAQHTEDLILDMNQSNDSLIQWRTYIYFNATLRLLSENFSGVEHPNRQLLNTSVNRDINNSIIFHGYSSAHYCSLLKYKLTMLSVWKKCLN